MLRRTGPHPLGYVALLVAATLLLSSCAAIAGRAVQMVRIKQHEARLEREVAELEARNAALRAQQAFYSSDHYIERIAREELGLVKPGETGVIVVRRAGAQHGAPAAELTPTAPPPQDLGEGGGSQVPAEGAVPPVWERWRAWLMGQ